MSEGFYCLTNNVFSRQSRTAVAECLKHEKYAGLYLSEMRAEQECSL